MSSSSPVVQVRNLSKAYRIYQRPQDRLKQSIFRRRRYYTEFWALRNISVDVFQGETVGVIGQNGSGKSTLLQIVAGTLQPTEGGVDVRGRTAALLELGAGFNQEYTGLENVLLAGAILGFSRSEMEARFDDIAAFADIGEFIDQPVKTYSTGMFVRLAFATAVSVEPDVLLVDEVLAVGDAAFQARCMRRIRDMRDHGVSILFVSHDLEAVKRLCDRVYVLRQGEIVMEGAPDLMANWYLAHLSGGLITIDRDASAPLPTATLDAAEVAPLVRAPPEQLRSEGFQYFRHGDRRGEVFSIQLLDSRGRVTDALLMGQLCTLRIFVRFHCDLPSAVVGYYVRDRLGTDILGTNTYQERVQFPSVTAGLELAVDFSFRMLLRPGFYSVTAGLAYSQHEQRYMDWIDNALVFQVIDSVPGRVIFGLVYPDTDTTVHVLEGSPARERV